jgi:hypothetical protein
VSWSISRVSTWTSSCAQLPSLGLQNSSSYSSSNKSLTPEPGLSYWASGGLRAGGPAHYARREPGVLDIFSEYSLKIPRIYPNMLEYTRYFLVGRAHRQPCLGPLQTWNNTCLSCRRRCDLTILIRSLTRLLHF